MTGVRGVVLVVDDDAESLRIICSILGGEGYNVRPAESGGLALASIQADPPDLILLDARIPDMDGFEVCRVIKTRETSRHIPLMFLGRSTDEEEQVKGFAFGAVDFIAKPVRGAELLARVATHLELSRLQTRLENTVAQRTAELRMAIRQLQHEMAERKSAESALSESEERFRNMADAAPVMIWVSGADKLRTFFSRRWLSFTGRPMERELGAGWTSGVHPDDLAAYYEKYSAAHDLRETYQAECRLRRCDGEYRWMLCGGLPRFGPDGVFAGFIGSCVDITDFKRAQEQALSAQKLQSIGLLAAGVGHDFNNLLGGVLANLDLLLDDFAAPSPTRESLLRIQSTAHRAVEIVRELLVYAGEEMTGFELIDLVPLAEEMVELLGISISKRARLNVRFGRNVPAVRANPVQIRQVMMNLIINASEALEGDEGDIFLNVTAVAPRPGGAEGNPSPCGCVRLEVSDTGRGMPDHVRERIFDPFFTTKANGRGLGLSAVRGIVRAHGGAIRVTSAPGNGCCFEILLPGVAGEAIGSHGVKSDEVPVACQGLRPTVLVIEDEDSLREAVTCVLRRRGFKVIEAADGSAAIDLFRRNHRAVDTVLLDITLPGIPSRDVLRHLRSERPEINVILTSAYGYETAVAAVDGQRPWEFVRKPYQLEDLVSLL